MAANFVNIDRSTAMLLPPDLRDWVAEDDLAHFVIEATCTPADITFPTDLKLLGEAREKTEQVIDILHAPFVGERNKPRTYRCKARKQFLAVAKQKKPGKRRIRKAIGQQLRYIKRNLGHIDHMLSAGSSLTEPSSYQHKYLLVIHEMDRQQITLPTSNPVEPIFITTTFIE